MERDNEKGMRLRNEEKKRMLEEVKEPVLIGKYEDYYMAENVREYFAHISQKVENRVKTVSGKRVYHVVMPYLENKVAWMKFISAVIDRKMRWSIWEN
ncbi:hypothetical protein C0431_12460 [bacterium]|nr:hypothetical protein [bacterium]